MYSCTKIGGLEAATHACTAWGAGQIIQIYYAAPFNFLRLPPCASITIYCKIDPFNRFEEKSFLRDFLEWLLIKSFVIIMYVPVMLWLPFRKKKKSNIVWGIFVTRFPVTFDSSYTVSTMLRKCFITDTSHKLICPNAVKMSF